METAGMTSCERQKMAGTIVPPRQRADVPEREGSGMGRILLHLIKSGVGPLGLEASPLSSQPRETGDDRYILAVLGTGEAVAPLLQFLVSCISQCIRSPGAQLMQLVMQFENTSAPRMTRTPDLTRSIIVESPVGVVSTITASMMPMGSELWGAAQAQRTKLRLIRQGVKGESEGTAVPLLLFPLGCRVRGQKTKGMSFQVLAL